MTKRYTSGSGRLDSILGGGLVSNSITLVIGLPGSGKTILAQQCLFANATAERPGLYCTTVSESAEKMLGFLQDHAFFDRDALGERVFFEDLSGRLHADGLTGVLDHLTVLLRERRPGLLVIDSFKALRPYAGSEEEFRRFLHGLVLRSSSFAMSSLWVGNTVPTNWKTFPKVRWPTPSSSWEANWPGACDRRLLRVLKMRGSGFQSGAHSYRIGELGLDAFPRLADPLEQAGNAPEGSAVRSGIPGLDQMVGGFAAGTSILLTGPAGVGKTVLGMHLVLAGVRGGEPGIIASFQEDPGQLERVARGFGLTLDVPGLSLLHRAPVGLLLDQWVYELLDLVAATGAKRVLIDGLGDLENVAWDGGTFREYLYSLLQRLAQAGVTLVTTMASGDLFGTASPDGNNAAHLVDNVLLLYFVEREGLWTRALRVLKSRGRSHSSQEAPFRIIDRGLEVVPGGD